LPITDSNSIDVSKKLSLESKHLLEEIGNLSIRTADLIPRLYHSLVNDGLKPKEAYTIITEKVDIGRRRLQQLIPPEAKNPKMARNLRHLVPQIEKVKEIAISKQPEIPPRPEVIQDVEPEPEPIEEPIRIQSTIRKIIFDPAPIDRDRTQVFIIHYDLSTNKIKRYETVGRKSLGR
jgi:hypothetical protein